MKLRMICIFIILTILTQFSPTAPVDAGIGEQIGMKANLAVGVPQEGLGGEWFAGAVHMIYSQPLLGLTSTYNELLSQDSPGIEGKAEEYDRFGWAVTAGDFNGDGLDDLAVGIPTEKIDDVQCGAVHVFQAETGQSFNTLNDVIWFQSWIVVDNCEDGDFFGGALASGDFNGDGYEDLAIGVPSEDVQYDLEEIPDAGMVNIIYASDDGEGLSLVGNESFAQYDYHIERDDRFGSSLAACDFNGDGYTDLAIGSPYEDLYGGFILNAGQVNVLFGSADGLSQDEEQIWDSFWFEGGLGNLDFFGYALACGNFDNDRSPKGYPLYDLAIGTPGKKVENKPGAGVTFILQGSTDGLVVRDGSPWSQGGEPGRRLSGEVDDNDHLGSALASCDFDNNGYDDLAIGVFGDRINTIPFQDSINAGGVNVIYGREGGLSTANQTLLDLYDYRYPFWPQTDAAFGYALACGDFHGDGIADLAVGVPGMDIGNEEEAGMVMIFQGFDGEGLDEYNGYQYWIQGENGLVDLPEALDQFGSALAALNHPMYWVALPIIRFGFP